MSTPDNRPHGWHLEFGYEGQLLWPSGSPISKVAQTIHVIEYSAFKEQRVAALALIDNWRSATERAEHAEAEIKPERLKAVAFEDLYRKENELKLGYVEDLAALTQQAEIYRAIILKFLEHSRECAGDYKYVYGDIVQEAHKALADWHEFKQGKGEE